MHIRTDHATGEMTGEEVLLFQEFIYDRCHLSLRGSREAQMISGIRRRMAACGRTSPRAYFAAAAADEEEFDRLVGLVTTQETYFFRMPEQFAMLGASILPAIEERAGRMALGAPACGERRRMTLRAWSAGCSTGQEAWSLSMQILGSLRYPQAWNVQVLGTDLDPEAVVSARRGVYGSGRMECVPPDLAARYLEPVGEGLVTVAGDPREVTDFAVLNLRRINELPALREAFDVIMCRNVLIYLDLPAQQELVTALSRCLRPGGHLFTGEGEVLHLYRHELEIVEQGGCLCYRRPTGRADG
jgi:chemotaxis protein methyltransferase CheR